MWEVRWEEGGGVWYRYMADRVVGLFANGSVVNNVKGD